MHNVVVDETNKCPECENGRLVRDDTTGELICDYCGLVVENSIDYGPDWRDFEGDASKSHTGGPRDALSHDGGLGTNLGWKNQDASGNSLPKRDSAKWYQMRKLQRRSATSDSRDKSTIRAIQSLQRVTSRMQINRPTQEYATDLYKKVIERNMLRGRSIEVVMAACLYASCRHASIPRTLDEIAKEFRISRKELGRTYRKISRKLKIKLQPTKTIDYIDRFASELQLSLFTISTAKKMAMEIEQNDTISGRGPTGMAAAILYISSIICDDRRSQREVADVCCVTEVTVRNRYQDMIKVLNIEIEIKTQ